MAIELIHIGFSNILAMNRVIAIASPNSAPTKRTIQEGKSSPEVYTIVGAAEANPRAGRISNESPLGRALLNRVEGDTVHVDAPAGAFEVKVIKVE